MISLLLAFLGIPVNENHVLIFLREMLTRNVYFCCGFPQEIQVSFEKKKKFTELFPQSFGDQNSNRSYFLEKNMEDENRKLNHILKGVNCCL